MDIKLKQAFIDDWIELIEIRSVGADKRKVRNRLHDLIEDMEDPSNKSIAVYFQTKLDTDYCIQIQHHSDEIEQNGSQIGQHLVSFFKDFGMVNHRVWVELKR